MKKEIVTIEDALTITSNAEINDAIRAMHEYSITSAKLEDEPYDEELKQKLAEMAIVVKSKQESIHQLHEMLEKMEATRKAIREVIESIVSEIPMPDHFKWQKGATTKKVSDMEQLAEIAEGNGITVKDFSKYCNTLSSKKAAEMLGLSEESFMQQYGSIVETSTNKDTLKRTH
ncbi:MAG: hypothetical protein HUK20_05870 [Fibrobacter sp.]|nr:hypothetical protein [Fibrobacter sp.]